MCSDCAHQIAHSLRIALIFRFQPLQRLFAAAHIVFLCARFVESLRQRLFPLPLLGGASLLALKSGCDVVPVYIEGHYKPFRRMVVHVGKPIEMADLRAGRMNKETCDALTERMEAAFARLSGGKSLPPAEKTPA